jgi:hypothetical protein
MKQRPPTDYRKTRRKHDRALLILVIVALVFFGDSLIGLIWGWPAAITGGLCLSGGAALIIGLWFLLGLLERWVGE